MSNILKLTLYQLGRLVSLLFFVSLATFALVSFSPVDPLQANLGQSTLGALSAEQIERLKIYWGVGIPFWERYFAWIGGFLQGDLGISLLYRREVSIVLQEKLANSLWLMTAAWVISGFLGILLGIIAGSKEHSLLGRLINCCGLIMTSVPTFWLALLLLVIFALWLGWLPIGLSVPIGLESTAVTWADRLRHGILPILTLSLTGISSIAFHTREKMIAVMNSDYVLFAKARGDSLWRIIRRHGLRNILLPTVTLQFAAISEIFGGSVLIEQVFSYPGLGQAAVKAGLGGDVPLLLGITMISAILVFSGNMIANILYGCLDPRMRHQWQKAGRQ